MAKLNPYHCITIIIRAEAWRRGLATSVCLCLCVCVCVCGLTSAHILPEHQHGHLGDTHPFLNYLPAFLHPYLHPSFFIPTNGEAAGGYDVCCVTQGHLSLSSCIFSPGCVRLYKQFPTHIGDDLR